MVEFRDQSDSSRRNPVYGIPTKQLMDIPNLAIEP